MTLLQNILSVFDKVLSSNSWKSNFQNCKTTFQFQSKNISFPKTMFDIEAKNLILGCHLSATSWARFLAVCDHGWICHLRWNFIFTVTRDFGSCFTGNFRRSGTVEGQRQRLFPVLVKGQAAGQNAGKSQKLNGGTYLTLRTTDFNSLQ